MIISLILMVSADARSSVCSLKSQQVNQETVRSSNTLIYLVYYCYHHLTAFFQDKLDKPPPERQNHSGF